MANQTCAAIWPTARRPADHLVSSVSQPSGGIAISPADDTRCSTSRVQPCFPANGVVEASSH